MAWFWALLFNILASLFVRWLERVFHFEGQRERWLGNISSRRARPKFAVTKKEILSCRIIEEVDTAIISETERNKIIDLLAERGLIRKTSQKDPHFLAPLTIDMEGLFLHLHEILEMTALDSLKSLYEGSKIACIAVLPFPRGSKSRMTTGFEIALIKRLGSQVAPIDFLTPSVLRKQPNAQALVQTKETEKILVLQPVALNDDYLKKCINYIRKHSVSPIAEILTIIDPSGRPRSRQTTDPPERVLITSNLGQE